MAKSWQIKNIDALLHYNALDCVVTATSYAEMLADEEWKSERVQKLHYYHTRLAKIAARMHDKGFGVNEGKRAYLSRQLKAMHLERREVLLKLVNDLEYNATPDDMRALLYTRHKIAGRRCFELADPPEYAKEMWTNELQNECAVNRPALLKLYVDQSLPTELHTIIRAYWEQAAPRKARSTYVAGSKVRNAIGRDGRLRPSWNSCGTETMRWSCASPNLMNLSEDKKEDALTGYLPNMRKMYEAAPGYVLVHADVSQQELRFMAKIANDRALQTALATGDVYTYDARQVFKIPLEQEVKKDARKQIKVVHLAFQYAAGTPAVYSQALVQDRTLRYSAVKLFHSQLKRLYCDTVQYWTDELKRVCDRGLYSEGMLLGTRVYYPTPPAITETANKPIQTTAGESMAIAMCQIEDHLLEEGFGADTYFVNILHDAFDIECREEDAFKIADIMAENMGGPWTLTNGAQVVTPVDIKIHHNWGKL